MKQMLKYLAYTVVVGVLLYGLCLAFERFIRNPKEEDELDGLEDCSYEEFEDESQKKGCVEIFADKVKAAADRQLAKLNKNEG